MRLSQYLFCCVVFTLAALTGCSSTEYKHTDLVNQIVRFRPGYAGLTHRICSKKKWNGDCENWDIIEYSIRGQAGRMRFVELGFICIVGGRRFKIDPDWPQLARYGVKDNGWFQPKTREIVETMDYKDVQKLVDAGTYCYSERTYPDGIPFQ